MQEEGPFSKVCHSKKPVRDETNVNGHSDFTAESAIHCVTQTASTPLTVQLQINGMQLPFEVDAGQQCR